MWFNEIYKFSDGTLTRILEALAYRVKEFKIKRLNLGMNTSFWTEKDVTRSKEFIAAIERRLMTRRIYLNLEWYSFPLSCQNRRDLPRDNPLVSIEVLRFDKKRSKSKNKGRVPTEMELVLEQTQQGTSHEVSVSTEGVEELKRNVRIKGEKKEALHTHRQKPGQYICCQNHYDDCWH
ncbi:hypothetical protein Tco_1514768 [Tanacetum coccineum]